MAAISVRIVDPSYKKMRHADATVSTGFDLLQSMKRGEDATMICPLAGEQGCLIEGRMCARVYLSTRVGIATSRDVLTPTEKYIVRAIEPKYAPVNGNRGPDSRCCTMKLLVAPG
jgi:hypothetical protein